MSHLALLVRYTKEYVIGPEFRAAFRLWTAMLRPVSSALSAGLFELVSISLLLGISGQLLIVGAALSILAAAFALATVVAIVRALFPLLRLARTLSIGARVPRTQRWSPGSGIRVPLLLQISDLHLTEIGASPYEVLEDDTLWEWRHGALDTGLRYSAILTSISRSARLSSASALVITGDTTDFGTTAAWTRFETITRGFTGVPQLVLIPGNHDLSINHWTEPEIGSREARIDRRSAYFTAMERLTQRGLLLACETEMHNAVGAATSALDATARHAATERPQVISLRDPTGSRNCATLIALDSCRYPSRFALSNAIGYFGMAQLKSLALTLSDVHGPLVVLCHHHVATASTAERSLAARLRDTFMVALDGRRLLELLCQYSKARGPVLILHGHKHRTYFEQYTSAEGGTVYVHGHPSSTMGVETASGLDGVGRVSLVGLSAKGDWIVEVESIDLAANAVVGTGGLRRVVPVVVGVEGVRSTDAVVDIDDVDALARLTRRSAALGSLGWCALALAAISTLAGGAVPGVTGDHAYWTSDQFRQFGARETVLTTFALMRATAWLAVAVALIGRRVARVRPTVSATSVRRRSAWLLALLIANAIIVCTSVSLGAYGVTRQSSLQGSPASGSLGRASDGGRRIQNLRTLDFRRVSGGAERGPT